MEPAAVVIGLSAVVVAVRDGEPVVLTVRPEGQLPGLPFGPFDPDGHRTFELALRAFVTAQTRFDLGYVEQLYTFGDKGRDAPLADLGAGAAGRAGRIISVGYLALTPTPVDTTAPDTGVGVFCGVFVCVCFFFFFCVLWARRGGGGGVGLGGGGGF